MVGPDGQLPLPWLAEPLRHALQTQRGHALLIHGPQGVGQFELALSLAQSWLCDERPATHACGRCGSCRLVQGHSHPDLLVLLPEALREQLGWSAGEEADGERASSSSKTKPSKDIKVESVRLAVAFAQTTAARGGSKVVLIHPAERMNGIAANTLLKTLEEPPGASRFLLSCGAAEGLLPTIRSRCQAVPLALPPTDMARVWLHGHQVAQPEVLLAAAGGQPLEALQWAKDGLDAAAWLRLPRQLAAGDAAFVSSWPLPRLLDGLQKLCHDAMCLACDAPPRYFPASSLLPKGDLTALNAWSRQLTRTVQHAEHPWNMPVMIEALVQQAQEALMPARVASD